MNKRILKIVNLFVILLFITACEDDDFNKVETLSYAPPTVTFTADSNDIDILEDEITDATTYTITASIAEPQNLDYYILLEQTGGTAIAGEDFMFDDHITISRGQTSGTATVTLLQSGDIEEDESFSIGAKSNTDTVVLSDFSFDVNIGTNNGANDFINDSLDLVLSWDGTAASGDVTIASFCDIDFDLILYDADFVQLGYVLGSADCPEEGPLGGLADGTYYLVADLYDNPFSGLGFTDIIPLTLSWSQEYFDTAGSISTADYNLSSVDGLGGLTVVLEVTNGYEFTVSNFN